MKKYFYIISFVLILLLLSYVSNTEARTCFDDFKFSKAIPNDYNALAYRQLGTLPIRACLPENSLWESDMKSDQLFSNLQLDFTVMKNDPNWKYWPPKDTSVPHINVLLRQAKDPADGSLQKWIEDRFSFEARGLTSGKLRAGCERIGYPTPYQIRYDLPFEKFGENSEFTKFQACNDLDNWYAVRVGTQVLLLKNDHMEPLEGMNEELLLNIIRSMRPVKAK